MSSVGQLLTFNRENNPGSGIETFVWKGERRSKKEDSRSGQFLWILGALSTSRTTDEERYQVKDYKIFKSHYHTRMNDPE